MKLNTAVVRSSQDIEQGLMERAEKGESRYSPEQMRKMIDDVRKRVQDMPPLAIQLVDLFSRATGGQVIPSSLTARFLIQAAKDQHPAIAKLNMREVLNGKDIEKGDHLYIDQESQGAKDMNATIKRHEEETATITVLSDYKSKKRTPQP